VNPFAPEEVADAMHQALIMPPAEKARRMQRMRSAVESNNIYRWAGKILEHALRVESTEPAVEDLTSVMTLGAA
jgi:trehalose 6-phosphate synthase